MFAFIEADGEISKDLSRSEVLRDRVSGQQCRHSVLPLLIVAEPLSQPSGRKNVLMRVQEEQRHVLE